MNFVISYWKELLIAVLIISLSIALFSIYNKPVVTVTIEDTKQIERLRGQVNKLNSDLKSLQTAYDNKQGETVIKIKKIKEQNAREINDLDKLSTIGRDSVWTTF
jgi:biopolymer transport protein ExbB/TolQ